jgi:hypothetical protein
MNSLSPDAPSYYDALQTKLTYRLKDGSQFGAVYTFSKAINWIDNEEVSTVFGGQGGYLFWPYPAYRYRNKALATYDRTHNLQLYGIYELPFGKSKRWLKSGVGSKIAGGWQVNWVLSKMSGTPFTITGGGSSYNALGNTQTANQVIPGPIPIIGGVGNVPGNPACAASNLSCHYFNPAYFAAVPSGVVAFGNSGRNIVRGPGFFNLDTSLFREFAIRERIKLQVRAEMFGATNTPHLNNPGTDVTNAATFGVITSTLNTAGRGTGTGGERQVWFSGKVTF